MGDAGAVRGLLLMGCVRCMVRSGHRLFPQGSGWLGYVRLLFKAPARVAPQHASSRFRAELAPENS